MESINNYFSSDTLNIRIEGLNDIAIALNKIANELEKENKENE